MQRCAPFGIFPCHASTGCSQSLPGYIRAPFVWCAMLPPPLQRNGGCQTRGDSSSSPGMLPRTASRSNHPARLGLQSARCAPFVIVPSHHHALIHLSAHRCIQVTVKAREARTAKREVPSVCSTMRSLTDRIALSVRLIGEQERSRPRFVSHHTGLAAVIVAGVSCSWWRWGRALNQNRKSRSKVETKSCI